jgi:hypothetical protein
MAKKTPSVGCGEGFPPLQHQQVEEAETITEDQQNTTEDLKGIAHIHTSPHFLAR